MSQLQLYKNFLIPVNDVLYVEYKYPNKNALLEDDQNGGTFVWIKVDGGTTKTIKISKKNVLVDFQKWFKQFSETAKIDINQDLSDWTQNITPLYPKEFCPYAPIPVNVVPFIQQIETDDKPFDISPKINCSKQK